MRLLVRRGLRDRLGRYVATGLAVVLGVALAVGSLVLTDTLRALLRTVSTTGAADVVVRVPATFDDARSRARIPAEVLDEVRAFDGVAAAAGIVAGQAIVIAPDGTPSLGRVGAPVGVSWVDDPLVAPVALREGTAPAPGQVVLDRRTAERTGVDVGGSVGIVAAGPVEQFVVAGVGEAPNGAELGLGSLTLFHPRDATRLLAGAAGFDSLLVALDPERDVEPTIDTLGRALGARVEVIRADDATRVPRIGFLPQLVTLFAGLGVVVGGFVVVNTFSMLIAQRVRELGLLRALGASVRQVRRLVLGEALVLGLVSATLGALVGAGIGWSMLRIAAAVGFEPPEGPVVVSGGRILFGIVLGLVVTCGAAAVPAIRASPSLPSMPCGRTRDRQQWQAWSAASSLSASGRSRRGCSCGPRSAPFARSSVVSRSPGSAPLRSSPPSSRSARSSWARSLRRWLGRSSPCSVARAVWVARTPTGTAAAARRRQPP